MTGPSRRRRLPLKLRHFHRQADVNVHDEGAEHQHEHGLDDVSVLGLPLPDVEDAAGQQADVRDVQPQEPGEAQQPGQRAVEGHRERVEEAAVEGWGPAHVDVAVQRHQHRVEEGGHRQAVGGVAEDPAHPSRGHVAGHLGLTTGRT